MNKPEQTGSFRRPPLPPHLRRGSHPATPPSSGPIPLRKEQVEGEDLTREISEAERIELGVASEERTEVIAVPPSVAEEKEVEKSEQREIADKTAFVAREAKPEAEANLPEAETLEASTRVEAEGRTDSKFSSFGSKHPDGFAGKRKFSLLKGKNEVATPAASRPAPKFKVFSSRSTPVAPLQGQNDSKRAAGRIKLKIALGAIGILSLLGGGAYALLFTPLLGYDPAQTQVVGAGPEVSEAEVKSFLTAQEGHPLLTFPTAKTASELKTAFPWIEKAQVSTSYPHGLRVELTLQKALARHGDKAITANGEILSAAPEMLEQLPELTQQCSASLAARCYREGISVIAALPAEVKSEVESYNVQRLDVIQLKLKNGASVLWGDAQNSAEKARVFALLRQKPAREYNLEDWVHPVVTE